MSVSTASDLNKPLNAGREPDVDETDDVETTDSVLDEDDDDSTDPHALGRAALNPDNDIDED